MELFLKQRRKSKRKIAISSVFSEGTTHFRVLCAQVCMGEDGMTVIEDSEAAASRDSKVTSTLATYVSIQTRNRIGWLINNLLTVHCWMVWIAGAVLRIRDLKQTPSSNFVNVLW